MPHLEKFSKNSWWALSSRNLTWEGVGSEEEDSPEWRGFQDGVDLCLGAMCKLSKRKRERERQVEEYQQDQYQKYRAERYVCIKNAWTCDMQH